MSASSCFQFTSHLGAAGRVDYFRSFELWYGGSCTGRYRGLAFYGYSSFDDLFAAYPEYRKHGPKLLLILTDGTMTLLYIVVGVICVILLPLYNNAGGKQGKDRR